MSGMKLSSLPSQAFSDVSVTESLRLDNNAIKSIKAEAFFSVRTRYLWVYDRSSLFDEFVMEITLNILVV